MASSRSHKKKLLPELAHQLDKLTDKLREDHADHLRYMQSQTLARELVLRRARLAAEMQLKAVELDELDSHIRLTEGWHAGGSPEGRRFQ